MAFKFTQETTHHGHPDKRVVILESEGGNPDRVEVRVALETFLKLEEGAEFNTLAEFERALDLR